MKTNQKAVLTCLAAILLMITIFGCAGQQASTGTGEQDLRSEPAQTGEDQGETGLQETGSQMADSQSGAADKAPVRLGLPPWPGVTVKSAVVKQALEEKGYQVETNQLDAGIVYSQLAEGNLDVLLAGWLPVTHEDYWTEHGDRLEKVTVNVPETWLGLAVPTYTYEEGITSLEDLKGNSDLFDYRIVGIEPGAGVVKSTEKAIETYGLEGYTLQTSSTAAMMAEVDAAMRNRENIAFTIWEPHSAFAMFDIKKLEDPQEIYGGGDAVYTITRKGFAQDYPEVQAFLENFRITPDTQSAWILEYSDNEREAEDVASEWISENRDLVNSFWE